MILTAMFTLNWWSKICQKDTFLHSFADKQSWLGCVWLWEYFNLCSRRNASAKFWLVQSINIFFFFLNELDSGEQICRGTRSTCLHFEPFGLKAHAFSAGEFDSLETRQRWLSYGVYDNSATMQWLFPECKIGPLATQLKTHQLEHENVMLDRYLASDNYTTS